MQRDGAKADSSPPPPQVDPRARGLAEELLLRAARWLEGERAAGRHHPPIARDVGGLAATIGLEGPVEIAARVLEDAPLEAFPQARVSDVDALESPEPTRRVATPAEIGFDYPPYHHEWIRGYLANFEDGHVRHALEGRYAEAEEFCRSELDREEYLAIVAWRHEFRLVLDALEASSLPPERRLTPLLVVAVESCRAGDFALSERVYQSFIEDCSAWENIQLAAGYLGRVPWNGYPFPDY